MTAASAARALTLATSIADRLAQPPATAAKQGGWQAQSLAHGAAGIALLPIERARTSSGGWPYAHNWLTAAASAPISAADDAGLFAGAPAVAFALHAAGPDRYTRALSQLDTRVAALTHRRADQAHARIGRGDLPTLAEFDLIYGLTGIGAYLLVHAPAGNALERVLRYLVRLTEPLRIGGETLPGWWTEHDPSFRSSPSFAGGHANLGLAHGITGPLALLALTATRGITVDGQHDAISQICTWLDDWRQDNGPCPWWPQWVTRDELHTGRTAQPGPGRPSWCYGTPGLARAQQIAALATGDLARQDMAEHALARCLSDPAQLAQITDTSLCHGWAGLFQTAWRTSQDARTPTLTACLPHLASQLTQHAHTSPHNGPGLLEGETGLALALLTAAAQTPPASSWDACLLLD